MLRRVCFVSHPVTAATIFAAVGEGVSAGRSDPRIIESDLTKTGLWVSRNSGVTWTQYPASTFGCQLGAGGPCPATDVAIDPNNPDVVYLGGSRDFGPATMIRVDITRLADPDYLLEVQTVAAL